MKKLYHYTRLSNAKAIIKSKKIKRTTLNIPKKEKSICWLSTNTINETSAYPNNPIEQLIDNGYIRFTVKNAKFLKIDYWKKIAKKANMHPRSQEALATTTEANPSEWYATLKDIPLALIEDIEYMDENENWISISKDELMVREAK